jgi:hypothetical protein
MELVFRQLIFDCYERHQMLDGAGVVAYLGASDPEMNMIDRLLRECGATVRYAELGGRRVRPADAYRAENIGPDATLVVECGPAPDGAVICDHHRPGDSGYGKQPSEFLPASSLGQVIAHLGQRMCDQQDMGMTLAYRSGAWRLAEKGTMAYREAVVPENILFAAAADHCLAAAYRGECPGVEPDALMEWRVRSRAVFQCRSAEEVLADVASARQALRSAPVLQLTDGIAARDMRGQHVPELPEASAREGLCFVADGLPEPDGRVKVVCQSGTPEQIRAFMQSWAPAHGLMDVYGDPARGFAGGYSSPARQLP